MNSDINKLFIVPLAELFDSELYDVLSLLIAPDKKSKLDNYKSDIDKKLGLYADLLLRIAIHQDLNIENSDIKLSTNSYGKPFLKNNQDYHFNISHTHNMIAVAISSNPVGVDVERTREIDTGIAKRFFTKREQNYIEKSQDDLYERFFEIWTKKEAYIKCTGKGLSVPLDSFDVTGKSLSERFYTVGDGKYIINMCGAEENIAPTTIIMPEAGLINLSGDLCSYAVVSN
ncbi:MAG: 4'-phosphopantetheinyl transferase superfamily protein [Clostridiales bacterium]|nr:4'-phosphopantetheinyl transferase superfamily protein [Clostridiales bacterium]